MKDPIQHSSIKSWVDEWGGAVDNIDYIKHHGDLAILVAFSGVLQPHFVEVSNCVLWNRVYEESNFTHWCHYLSGDVRKIEATLNQLHVWQLVDASDNEEDQRALQFVAKCVADAWQSALIARFPGRDFCVRILTTEDGPTVTFTSVHQSQVAANAS